MQNQLTLSRMGVFVPLYGITRSMMIATKESNNKQIIRFGMNGIRSIFNTNYNNPITQITYSRDMKYVLAGNEIGEVLVWDANSTVLIETIKTINSPITQLKLLSDNSKLVFSNNAGDVFIYDLYHKNLQKIQFQSQFLIKGIVEIGSGLIAVTTSHGFFIINLRDLNDVSVFQTLLNKHSDILKNITIN
jgi:WD40 repeat protein